MSMTYEEECNTEQTLVSEPSVDASRRSSKRVLVIGGVVALGFVAVFFHNRPRAQVLSNIDGAVGLKSKTCTCPNGKPKKGAACKKDGAVECDSCDAGFIFDSQGACKDGTCNSYKCPEGLIQLLGSKSLAKPGNDANCCAACPRGWVQLGKKGEEAPGWGLSKLGSTAPSLSNCANACKDNADCFSFKWHHANKNCIFMSESDSSVQAQTSKWDNVITCVEATCKTTGLSTSGAGEGVPCKFPFRYKSKTYHTCTSDRHNNMNVGGEQLDDQKLTTWCATETQDGEAVAGKWGHCSEECKVDHEHEHDPDHEHEHDHMEAPSR